MSQRESYTVYPRNPVDEMDLTLISGPTVTAPTSALTEGPGPAPGGGEALSESNRSENYRLLRISLREGSVVVRGLQVTSARDQELVVGGVLPEPPTSSPMGKRVNYA